MTIDIRARVHEALGQGYLMNLATVDDGGAWVAPVVYFCDTDSNIYWMSDPDVRHSQAIAKNSKVAASIVVSAQRGQKNFGLQIEGAAHAIEGERHDLAVIFNEKRGKPAPKEGSDILHGDSWYQLKPTKIELIDELNFGYDKQTFTLK